MGLSATNAIKRFLCSVAVLCATLVANVAVAEMVMVTVGNAGNAADPATGHGSVGYNYQIGKFEVTAGQYTEFLNAVAAKDTYGLYNSSMASTSSGSGISRSGSSGSYSYSVASAFENRPVNYVSWYDAARYCNWLTTTNTESGVYTFSGATTVTGILDHQAAAMLLSVTTAYFLPTDDEWYKAAYHDKSAGPAATYFPYPTSSNTAPGRDMADPLPGNNANYNTGSGDYPIDSGKYTTVAGEFQNSDSPYGAFDQGGNLWEWNETLDGPLRVMRGGAFDSNSSGLASSSPGSYLPSLDSSNIGFRVASVSSVPEPGSIALLVSGGIVGLILWRRVSPTFRRSRASRHSRR